MADLNVSALKVLAEVFAKATEHHDTTNDAQHDLSALSNQAMAVMQGPPAKDFLAQLLESPIVSQLVSVGLAALVARLTAPKPPKVTEVPPPVPVPVVIQAPVVTSAPAPGAPMPDGAGLDIEEVFGPNRTGRKQRMFRVADPSPGESAYKLIMLDDAGNPDSTTSLDDQSGLFLAGILFREGKTVKIEQVEGARGRLYWKATNIDTGEVNKLSKVNGVWTASNNEHATNWRTDGEIANSDGFAATVHLHDRASGYDITFGVEGLFEAVPIRTPEVR